MRDLLYPLRRLHGQIYEKKQIKNRQKALCNELVFKISTFLKQSPDAGFLVMTPSHGNLGDHAIVQAEEIFLKTLHIPAIEIKECDIQLLCDHRKLNIFNEKPIFITGGGNIGTLWMQLESLQREIIRYNPKSPIFVFPNTAYFENSSWGRRELKNTQKSFRGHRALTVCAREQTSFDILHGLCDHVLLIPDMVLSLNECRAHTSRSGCLLCLRSDCEKTRTQEQESQIVAQIRQLFGENFCYTDMNVNSQILPEQREAALKEKFDQFRSAELVITDRLHGMIFCAITGTPCIVINSKSHKVRGCYQWIKNLNYIRFAENPEEITGKYREIPNTEHIYENGALQPYYKKLTEVIKSYAGN